MGEEENKSDFEKGVDDIKDVVVDDKEEEVSEEIKEKVYNVRSLEIAKYSFEPVPSLTIDTTEEEYNAMLDSLDKNEKEKAEKEEAEEKARIKKEKTAATKAANKAKKEAELKGIKKFKSKYPGALYYVGSRKYVCDVFVEVDVEKDKAHYDALVKNGCFTEVE